jgi:SAM-dependent methyltransferase
VSKKRHTRWQVAQEYERNWWNGYGTGIEWYHLFSEEVEHYTQPFLQINKNTKILEIGSGPAGALTFLQSDNKYAIDPLEDFFATKEEWVRLRDPRVNYQKGKGEALPYGNDFFDLIILDNVLDHCEDPVLVLDEISRVLNKDGIVFFRQSIYSWWGRSVRKIMELLAIDRGHPHTFGKRQLIDYFKEQRWGIKDHKETGYLNAWIEDARKMTPKGLAKALLFINHNRTLYILEKQDRT